jgi:hypothetical protein
MRGSAPFEAAPGQQHFAADSIAILEFLLDDQDRSAVERHRTAKRAPGDAAPDDDQVI